MAPHKTSGNTKVSPAKKGDPTKAKAGHNGSVAVVETRILEKMAKRHSFGVIEVSKDEVLKFAGYSFATARRFIDATKSLQEKGYIEYSRSSKSYRLTEAGLQQVPSAQREKPKSNTDFHAQLKEDFESPKADQLLDMLADGRVHDRQTVCTTLGYKYQTATAFAKSVKELNTLGFLEAAGRGKFKLTDKVFPLGRPK